MGTTIRALVEMPLRALIWQNALINKIHLAALPLHGEARVAGNFFRLKGGHEREVYRKSNNLRRRLFVYAIRAPGTLNHQ